MEITTSEANGRFPVTIFHLKGDLMDEEPLQSQAQKAVAEGSRHILLDLEEVPYISSAGLRGIQAVFQLLQDSSGADSKAMRQGILAGTYRSPNLKLLNPSKNGMKALGVAGYDMFLEIHHDRQTAVDSF
ncbi:MAG: STAS domain-containing protein [Ardenticatenaceae bacterium]|nr:STAS domain-containing protein [Anaerolineales bacterium]MCB8983404.1 STAS domain-containing protein [Ardenticatenaceae bacterium]